MRLRQSATTRGVRVVVREGPVERGVEIDHFRAHAAQRFRRECARRAVAAGGHDPKGPRDPHFRRHVGDVALHHALDAGQPAAGALDAGARQHDLLQAADLVGAEGEGLVRAHLHPGPAVLVVAGGDHGHAGGVEVELGEIGHGRKGQADVEHLAAGRDQAQAERLLHRQRIGTEIVADHHARRHADLVDIGPQAQAQGLDAQQVDLLFQDPARVVFPETRRLDQGRGLVGQGVGQDVGARRQRHGVLRKAGCLDGRAREG